MSLKQKVQGSSKEINVYLGKEFVLCEKCQNQNDPKDYYLIIFEKCTNCKLRLEEVATVEEVFFLMRIWKPNIQKNMHLLIDLVYKDRFKLLHDSYFFYSFLRKNVPLMTEMVSLT